ncbi:hypothetical protein ACIQ9J_21805 [Streptomyces sp. NPDC094153]|uniref:DUF7736 domain-containing protein n=1 Tax=Streptomyces sp. NPDC094153 TaxID=3366058 RepID=UPI0037F6160D
MADDSRLFPLADVLTVTTGRLLSHRHMDGVYGILNYMTGESLFTHQLPRAADVCGPALLAQHPQLQGVAPPEGIDVADLKEWLASTEREYGEELPVAPLAAGTWETRDPIEEPCDMVCPEKVYVVPLPGEASDG